MTAGYEIVRERVTWTRWDLDALRIRITHPWVWTVTGPDGSKGMFDTRSEAQAWVSDREENTSGDGAE